MLNIFLTNLGKYNEGILQGEWVTLPCADFDVVLERIGCNDPGYEETFISDYDTDIDDLEVGEWDSYEKLNDLAETMENLADYEREIVGALLSYGYDLDDALEKMEDCRLWEADSMADVAEQYCDECGLLDSIPGHLRNYFDFEAYGRDMQLEGTFIETESGYVEVW